MSNFLIFAQWYATIQGHFVHLHATRFTNFYVIVNNMAIAMPQSTRAPPGGDNCSWRTLLQEDAVLLQIVAFTKVTAFVNSVTNFTAILL